MEEAEQALPDSEEVKTLNSQITELQTNAGQLGEEGKTDECLAVLKLVEELEKKKIALVQGLQKEEADKTRSLNKYGMQKLRVCQVCACVLIHRMHASNVSVFSRGESYFHANSCV